MAENDYPLMSGGNFPCLILTKRAKHFLFTLEKSIYVKWNVLWVNMVEGENFQ